MYLRACAPSEDFDQRSHSRNQIRIVESSPGRVFFIAKYEKSLLADKEDPDQTAPMLKLIRDLVGHKCQKVRFLTLGLF